MRQNAAVSIPDSLDDIRFDENQPCQARTKECFFPSLSYFDSWFDSCFRFFFVVVDIVILFFGVGIVV